MNHYALIAIDILAISILTFVVYLRRHRRRDLAVAYIGVNVGVLAVATILSDSSIGMGVGLGLFGVLSIIRLRSDELAQHEVAYYFAALALGLLGGMPVTNAWLNLGGMALVVIALTLVDHPKMMTRYRHQVVVLDRAIVREDELRSHLSALLNATIQNWTVQRLDLVNDTTVVDVRYTIGR